jgi:Rod binding domain-containing protein
MSPIGPTAPATSRQVDSPERVKDAAQQFEALLIGQILRGTHESTGGSTDCAMDYAEQQFATVMAQNGGLGLATLIANGLKSK